MKHNKIHKTQTNIQEYDEAETDVRTKRDIGLIGDTK